MLADLAGGSAPGSFRGRPAGDLDDSLAGRDHSNDVYAH